jgi:hypothetical protein
VLAVFASAEHADLAFDTLEGPAESDNYGMPTKKVSLGGREHAFVVKTFASQEDKLAALGKVSKHTQTEETMDSSC